MAQGLLVSLVAEQVTFSLLGSVESYHNWKRQPFFRLGYSAPKLDTHMACVYLLAKARQTRQTHKRSIKLGWAADAARTCPKGAIQESLEVRYALPVLCRVSGFSAFG